MEPTNYWENTKHKRNFLNSSAHTTPFFCLSLLCDTCSSTINGKAEHAREEQGALFTQQNKTLHGNRSCSRTSPQMNHNPPPRPWFPLLWTWHLCQQVHNSAMLSSNHCWPFGFRRREQERHRQLFFSVIMIARWKKTECLPSWELEWISFRAVKTSGRSNQQTVKMDI